MKIDKNTLKFAATFGAGIGTGFVLGWETAVPFFKKRFMKVIPVLEDVLTGVINQGYQHRFDPEFMHELTQNQMGIFSEAMKEALKS